MILVVLIIAMQITDAPPERDFGGLFRPKPKPVEPEKSDAIGDRLGAFLKRAEQAEESRYGNLLDRMRSDREASEQRMGGWLAEMREQRQQALKDMEVAKTERMKAEQERLKIQKENQELKADMGWLRQLVVRGQNLAKSGLWLVALLAALLFSVVVVVNLLQFAIKWLAGKLFGRKES